MSRNTKEFGSRVSIPSELIEPSRSTTNDSRCDSYSLDVGDGSGTSEESDIGREWRLQSGFTLLSFDRFDESSLFSANVSSSSSVEVDIEIVAGSTGVLAEVSSFVGFVDRLLNVVGLHEEFSSNVDVGCEDCVEVMV